MQTANFNRQHNLGLNLATARVHGHRDSLMLGIDLLLLEATSMISKTARVWFKLARLGRQERWVCQWAREAMPSITTDNFLPAILSAFLHSISFIFTAFMFILQH
jgi:hypothetical protein